MPEGIAEILFDYLEIIELYSCETSKVARDCRSLPVAMTGLFHIYIVIECEFSFWSVLPYEFHCDMSSPPVLEACTRRPSVR